MINEMLKLLRPCYLWFGIIYNVECIYYSNKSLASLGVVDIYITFSFGDVFPPHFFFFPFFALVGSVCALVVFHCYAIGNIWKTMNKDGVFCWVMLGNDDNIVESSKQVHLCCILELFELII